MPGDSTAPSPLSTPAPNAPSPVQDIGPVLSSSPVPTTELSTTDRSAIEHTPTDTTASTATTTPVRTSTTSTTAEAAATTPSVTSEPMDVDATASLGFDDSGGDFGIQFDALAGVNQPAELYETSSPFASDPIDVVPATSPTVLEPTKPPKSVDDALAQRPPEPTKSTPPARPKEKKTHKSPKPGARATSATPQRKSPRRPAAKSGGKKSGGTKRANTASANSPAASANQPFSWNDILRVQNLIERCLQQYLSKNDIVVTLKAQAKVDPAFTAVVWQKLEEQNPAFFRAYNLQLQLKEQILAFNYLVAQQKEMMVKASGNPALMSALVMDGRPSTRNAHTGQLRSSRTSAGMPAGSMGFLASSGFPLPSPLPMPSPIKTDLDTHAFFT